MTETEGDFEITYARKYGLSVEELHQLGLFAVPCECGQEGCKGWAMVTRETVIDHVSIYLRKIQNDTSIYVRRNN